MALSLINDLNPEAIMIEDRRELLKATAWLGAIAFAARGTGAGAAAFQEIRIPPATNDVVPFRVSVAPRDIADLKRRLNDVRWPEEATVSDWGQGVPLSSAKTLVDYWRDRYDWRAFERKINAFPQYRTKIDGLGIHFLHVKSKHETALPIIMSHGWPGSVVEFLEVIAPLTDPTAHGGTAEQAFHVIVPSLPGFGFTDRPSERGWDFARTAAAWSELMKRLGYKKWVAQGGDLGGAVTMAMAHLRPPGLIAAHVNFALVVPDPLPKNPTPGEKIAMDSLSHFSSEEFGYFSEQATRPQTIGYSLADSAVGQATWLYEKFRAWSENKGDPADAISIDKMLDDISLYWFTNTSASTSRMYWEITHGSGPFGFNAGHIDLPMAASIFPKDLLRPPREWAERLWPNLFYWNQVEEGGHYAAWEQPKIFTAELRKAFSKVGRA